jgi:nitric oxide reductase NorD protein
VDGNRTGRVGVLGATPPVDDATTRGLGLLASAIAGRRVAVVAVETDSTYTDGRQIYVDQSAPQNLRDAVVVHAALLAGGSFQRSIVLRLSLRRAAVGHRYLALEAARVTNRFNRFLPLATVSRVGASCPAEPSKSAEESLRRALSTERIGTPPPWIGVVKTRRLLRASDADLGGNPTDTDVDGLTPIAEVKELAENEAEESAENKAMKLLSAPGVSNPISQALQKLLGMGRAQSTTQGGGAELPVGSQRTKPVGKHAKTMSISRAIVAIFEPSPEDGIRYPEWDAKNSAYQRDWCMVTQCDPPDHSNEPLPSQLVGNTLRRPIARVGLERTQHLRQPDGDTLDLSALVDSEVDRRRGDIAEPRIYSRSRYTKRDLSVLVLLDCSGSTAEGLEGRTVFEGERRLAGDLTDSLEDLGDHVATYGFYSRGRDSVRFLRVKEFGDRFHGPARRRLRSIEPTGYTRFGAAVRHGGHLLRSHALSRTMILVYIGDGLPYDDGYEESYARADSHRAIRETIDSGIGVVGLAIRSSTEPAVVEEIWSQAPFRVIGDTRDARRHLRPMLLDAIRMTRSNGRRRDLATTEHRRNLQTLMSVRRSTQNSYV